jgi:hypothetical protein
MLRRCSPKTMSRLAVLVACGIVLGSLGLSSNARAQVVDESGTSSGDSEQVPDQGFHTLCDSSSGGLQPSPSANECYSGCVPFPNPAVCTTKKKFNPIPWAIAPATVLAAVLVLQLARAHNHGVSRATSKGQASRAGSKDRRSSR